MKGWKDLQVVETIYEEDHEEEDNEKDDGEEEEDEEDYSSSTSSPFLLLTPCTSLNSSLESTIRAWSLATGLQTDVIIKVQDQTFHLHKDPLMLRSRYLKRRLTESSEITLSPPLKITAETFSSIVDFCYCSHIGITPFNVAPLRIAAELLDMKEDSNGDNDGNGDKNLQMKTENYFSQAISVNRDYAVIILRSCLALLPESEITASLASRCIVALGLTDSGDGDNNWINDVKSLAVEEFQIIVYSMQDWLTRTHDLLYRIVDFYLKENGDKITEEEKTKICNSIDCEKLSPNLIVHAVQNQKMPLRFIVRAMFIDQLNTRHSISNMINKNPNPYKKPQQKNNNNNNNSIQEEDITLGAILQRDAAQRQVAHLQASVEATTSKIESLEKQVRDMKKLLNDKCEKKSDGNDVDDDSSCIGGSAGKSASFRRSSETKIERGDRGSTSLVHFNGGQVDKRGINMGRSFSSSSSSSSLYCKSENINSLSGDDKRKRTGKGFGWKLLMKGLKSRFSKSSSTSSSSSKSRENSVHANTTDETEVIVSEKVLNEGHGNEDKDGVRDQVSMIKRDGQFHRRSHSIA